MRRNTWLLTLLFVLMSLLASNAQVRDRDVTWRAPADATSKLNPLTTRTDAVMGGRKLFHQRCSACHGQDGRGTTKAPDLTQPEVQTQTDGALFWKISGGNAHHGMPAFSFLPEPQRWQLVLHLRAAVSSREERPGSQK